MSENIKIEIHLLQNFSPSCLNRDDSNSPKDCEFGGVRRARISSQCIKKNIRDSFNENHKGIRTTQIKGEIFDKVKFIDNTLDNDIVFVITNEIVSAFISSSKSDDINKTSAIAFISKAEIIEYAQCIVDLWKEMNEYFDKDIKNYIKKKKKDETKTEDSEEKEESSKGKDKRKKIRSKFTQIQERLDRVRIEPDIALFGRMMAENPKGKKDASCQVAHAISTHRVDMDMDFYTAVDDLNKGEDTGAGMMGVTGFNSACFYRYAVIDRGQLISNLQGDAEIADKAIKSFLEASIKAIPTGKQNTFAAQNPPSFGLFIVRKDGFSCSLSNAFAKPVYVGNQKEADLIGKSIEVLDTYYANMKKVYGDKDIIGESFFLVGYDKKLHKPEAQCDTVEKTLENVMASINKAVSA